MSSITSSQHNISESSQKKLQENISNIIPIITTPPTNSSAIKTPKQKYITKIKEKVENSKIKILTPSRPHVKSSTDCTSVEPHSKHLEYKLPIQQLPTPVTNGTSQTSLVPPASYTVDIHDPKKVHLAKPTKTSIDFVDNKIITSNRRHHPPRIKYYTPDS